MICGRDKSICLTDWLCVRELKTQITHIPTAKLGGRRLNIFIHFVFTGGGHIFRFFHILWSWFLTQCIALPCIRLISVPYLYRKQFNSIDTPKLPNSHRLKIQDGGGRHLEFLNNVNNFLLDNDILHQIIWEDTAPPCGDDHVTKSWNRKLIRVTSSNEGLKHICVEVSDYNIYLNGI